MQEGCKGVASGHPEAAGKKEVSKALVAMVMAEDFEVAGMALLVEARMGRAGAYIVASELAAQVVTLG